MVYSFQLKDRTVKLDHKWDPTVYFLREIFFKNKKKLKSYKWKGRKGSHDSNNLKKARGAGEMAQVFKKYLLFFQGSWV